MADKTLIEWTDATWNIITGCTLVDEGCRHCYAARLAATRLKAIPSRKGLARLNAAGEAKFTGEVRFNDQWLDQPLRWKRPRRIFVCAHGDLFHENVPDDWIDKVFAVMALAPQHTFQVLTKRPDRMRAYITSMPLRHIGWGERPMGAYKIYYRAEELASNLGHKYGGTEFAALLNRSRPERFNLQPNLWPLPNVWLGTSISDQPSADRRIPDILATPAAVWFLSAEPLLGPVTIPWAFPDLRTACCHRCGFRTNTISGVCPNDGSVLRNDIGVNWVIVGGESGPKARPMHPDWARSLRDQCMAAGVAFHFKQCGEWSDGDHLGDDVDGCAFGCFNDAGRWLHPVDQRFATAGRQIMFRVGKRAAGRMLDGREWNELPGVTR